jgi:hypothetical protein
LNLKLPQSRAQVADWITAFEKMNVTDLGRMDRELRATAASTVVLRDASGESFLRIERKIQDAIEGHHTLKIASKELTKTIGTNMLGATAKLMGLPLEKLEQQLKGGTVDAAKFGNALEEAFIEKGGKGLDAMWMRTGVVSRKLKDTFGELFSGVDTSPLTQAMVDIISLFDQSQPSGQAMKTTITTAFNAIIKKIGEAMTQGELWLLDMEIIALSIELALIPVWKIIKKIGEALGHDLGNVLGLAIGTAGAPAAGPTTPQQAQASALGKAGLAADVLAGMLPVGGGIAQGLINGMIGMIPEVHAAGVQVGKAGVAGAKEGAGVHSPSLPGIQIGGFIAEGLGLGMTSSPIPERAGRTISGYALGGMVGQALTAPAANANGGGGLALHIGSLVVQGQHGITDATALSASGLAVALERYQLASGR